MKKIIVIGAGVSGLASALRLKVKGYDVTIYEKNGTVGGRMNQIKMDGFSFDLGPTIVMMPDIYKEVFKDCGVNPDDYIRMTRLDPIYTVYFGDGTTHEASSELSKLLPELEKFGFDEASGYLNYIADTYKRYLIAKDHFIGKSFRTASDFYNLQTLNQALKLKTFNNAYDSVAGFVKSDKLRELLSFQTLYIGVSPYNGPSIYTIIPMIELIYGVWYIQGGMYAMAKAMERLFLEMGGIIVFDAEVTKINLEKRSVKSIEVNGEEQTADSIICSADFPYALDQLLPDNFKQGKYSKHNVKKIEYSCSCYMLYLGLDNDQYEGLNIHNLAFSREFKKNLEDIFQGHFPEDASLYVYAPGLIDKTLVPEGKLGLYVLVPVPNLKDSKFDWKNETVLSAIRENVYSLIERIKPLKGFREHVISEKIYTPRDFEKDFHAMYGATFGLKPTLLQSNYFRPQPKASEVDNLYFTGSSAHPGAGVPIVLTSAKLVVEEILKDDKNKK